jgi:hypothetical protein
MGLEGKLYFKCRETALYLKCDFKSEYDVLSDYKGNAELIDSIN